MIFHLVGNTSVTSWTTTHCSSTFVLPPSLCSESPPPRSRSCPEIDSFSLSPIHLTPCLQTLHSASPALNYDIRRRLTPIESSLQVAKETILAVSKRVTELRSNPSSTSSATDGWLDRSLTVTAQTPAALNFQSTGGREMWFTSHHSIHHLGPSPFFDFFILDLSSLDTTNSILTPLQLL